MYRRRSPKPKQRISEGTNGRPKVQIQEHGDEDLDVVDEAAFKGDVRAEHLQLHLGPGVTQEFKEGTGHPFFGFKGSRREPPNPKDKERKAYSGSKPPSSRSAGNPGPA